METIKKVSEQALMRLQALSQENSEVTQGNKREISLYSGNLTTNCIVHAVARTKKAFPSLPIDFYDVLTDRLLANGFCDSRLNDAVNHVIDTCIYPTPTIANFISWDNKVKVYKYPEIVKMLEDGDPNAFIRYQRIILKDLPEAVWIHVNDIAKYKIESL